MSQAEKPLNVALIGLGMVAQTHLRAVRDLAPLVQLHGVLATTPDKAERFAAGAAERWGSRGESLCQPARVIDR